MLLPFKFLKFCSVEVAVADKVRLGGDGCEDDGSDWPCIDWDCPVGAFGGSEAFGADGMLPSCGWDLFPKI